MMKTTRIFRSAHLFATIAFTCSFTQAQAPPASQPVKGALAVPYIDASFGFSISPPAGCTTYRQKRFVGTADIEIVQFVNLDDQWSLTVRLSTTTQPLDTKTIVEGITANIASKFNDVKLLTGDETRIADREGVRYAASFVGDGSTWLRQQAVIRTKPTEYYGLVFITPLSDRPIAGPTFDKIVAGFQILRTEAVEKRLEAGLERGKQLLRSIVSGETKLSTRIVPENYLRFVLDGEEIGFVQIREQARSEGAHEGVEIREWAWLFKSDDTTTHMQHDMFLTDDLTFEKWENRVVTFSAAKKDQPRQAVYDYESGLRQDDKLIVAYMPQPNAPQLHDKVIEVENSYASAAWHSLLPRVVDLKVPQLYAFSSYSADRRGLVLRAFEVLGTTQVDVNSRRVTATKLQDSEGLIPPINEIDVDDQGRILRVSAGSLEMTATTREYAERRYGKQVSEFQAMLKKYPIKEPTAAPRDRPPPPQRGKKEAPGGE